MSLEEKTDWVGLPWGRPREVLSSGLIEGCCSDP